MASENPERITLTLSLSTSQYEAVSQLFQESQWDLDAAVALGISSAYSESDIAMDTQPDQLEYHIPPVEGRQPCPFCFCCPCITDESNRQFWWKDDNQIPNVHNSEKRKKLYKMFWTMIYHRGAWDNPLYQARKQAALGADPQRRRYVYIYHRRDIMPDCVVKLVRGWLPHPLWVPYMGHLWD